MKNSSSNRKSNGSDIKLLSAQKMSKEVNFGHDSPNLVAKLMGLDSSPRKESSTAIQRSYSRDYPNNLFDNPLNYQKQNGYEDPNKQHLLYEAWQQFCKSPQMGRYEETINSKSMALVREKFIEAKRMSIDKKLCQSKQFQDALEVLSSHKELFLKCLQEPNSMFYQQSVSPPTDRKRITILRPSMMAENGKQMNTGAFHGDPEKILPGSPHHGSSKDHENSNQPTQIFVLKPSLRKLYDLQTASPQAGGTHITEGVEDKNRKPREGDAVVSEKMCEQHDTLHRNEASNSNGYVGDQTSFNKSETECAESNLSDSNGNGIGSPSPSTFSRASSSSKLSVSREAKKRLSERWTMMAMNASFQESKHSKRSSITLGEVLSLSEPKKSASPGEECRSIQQPKTSTSLLVSSARPILRSKSVPASTDFRIKLHIGIPSSNKGKLEAVKNDRNTRITSSFAGKVSSFFFSRYRKPGKHKYISSEEACKDRTGKHVDEQSNAAPSRLPEQSRKRSSSSLIGHEIGSAAAEPTGSNNRGENENQDPPNSISVTTLIQEHGADPLTTTLIEKSPIQEQEKWCLYVKKLLSSADGEVRPDSILAQTDTIDDELAKDQQWRSNQKLVFDCVNAALSEVTKDEWSSYPWAEKKIKTSSSVDEVWSRLNDMFSGAAIECVLDDSGESSTYLTVDKMARNEVAGKGWIEHLKLEMDKFGEAIGDAVVADLVRELAVELAAGGG
ncbi:uncharacterized protein LOC127242823 isoform X2 [Andrographis paniculata]|nr:uncharacterized protein LOC127242823 isoform X2 [Andrographis paniculata]